jgi:hypothetical protein
MKRVSLVAAAAALLAGVPAAAQSPPPPTSHPPVLCLLGSSYHVAVERGSMSCIRARRVMRRYLRADRSPRGWKCRHARGREDFHAQCRRRTGSPRTLLRTYPLMDGGSA